MARVTPQHELDLLLNMISAHPAGVGIDALAQQSGHQWERRTLQRRLATLLSQGHIEYDGGERSRRYRLPEQSVAVVTPVGIGTLLPQVLTTVPAPVSVALSAEGAEIRAYVTQSRQARQPVSYRLAFLEDYYPNQTSYLPAPLREQLHEIGRSGAGEAAAGTFARDILNRLLIDLSWASSQLEGNTYSRLDTERLIERGQVAEGKDALDTQMILNHKQAIEFLVLDPAQAQVEVDTIVALHALLSDGLMVDPLTVGRVRRRPVEIGGSVNLPLAVPQQLEELFGIVVRMAAEIDDPFEQAFFLMVHLPYLQPFEDVNKRVSRLAANIPLIQRNLCPLAFIDVPQQLYVDAMLGVYELNRVELLRDVFVWAYERSCQQYVAVRRTLVPPDVFRLRHRLALAEVIAALVRADAPAEAPAVSARMPASVPPAEQDHFVRLVLTEFESLHPGNAVRFGLRPLEFSAWQQRHRPAG